MILFWILVFAISLALLVKSADWLLESSEKIGLKLGLTPFIVGVVIVGIGTSLPELISSIRPIISSLAASRSFGLPWKVSSQNIPCKIS